MALTASGRKNVIKLGERVFITVHEAIEKGDLVTSTGYKADANADRVAEFVAGHDAPSSGTLTCFTEAILDGTDSVMAPYGGTEGAPLYLSDTAGDFSESMSTTCTQQVGYMLSATRAYLAPGTRNSMGGHGTSGAKRTVTNGCHFAEWYLSFATGTSPCEGLTIHVTDACTNTGNYARGIYVDYTASGTKTTNGEVNVIAADVTVSGDTPYLYNFCAYQVASGDPTIGFAAALSIYIDDLGDSCVHICAIDIGLAQGTNSPADRHCFMRCRAHSVGAMPDSVFRLEGANAADYLFRFDTLADQGCIVPTGGNYSSADGYIEIIIGASAMRLPYFAGTD